MLKWQTIVAIALSSIPTIPLIALAQLIPDTTLGNERSRITERDHQTTQINGGARRNSNLFHSFEQFNINQNQIVEFSNPSGVENIFSRVTGANASRILGNLSVDGTANLFLLNPNGIIFGVDASLDLRGSFIATTADAIIFDRGLTFGVELGDRTLPQLTVNPSAFLFNQLAAQPIISRADLQVPNRESLILLGGNLTFNGGSLTATDGQIELGSVNGSGQVSLTGVDRLRLRFPVELGRSPLTVRGVNQDFSRISGGSIGIHAGAVTLNRAQLSADASRGRENIEINAQDTIQVNESIIRSTAFNRIGETGNITLTTPQDLLIRSSTIDSSTSDIGIGGSIQIRARSLQLEQSGLLSNTLNPGDAGSINVRVDRDITLAQRSVISSSTGSSGNGGLIDLQAPTVSLRDSSALFTQTTGSGRAGNLRLVASTLTVQDGSRISASTANTGRSGNLEIDATDSITVSGALPGNPPVPSSIFARTIGRGAAGNISISTPSLTVNSGAAISVSAASPDSRAGNLTIEANTIHLNQGRLTAETNANGGANIRLQGLTELRMRDRSLISAQAFNQASGGNINIDAPDGVVIAVPQQNNDIIANASAGQGGEIRITASGIFGIAERSAVPENSTNDIDASSQFGQDGIVEIILPDVDPSEGLTPLPNTIIDASRLIARTCGTGETAIRNQSEFTITGRGGLPPHPADLRSNNSLLTDWSSLNRERDNETIALSTSSIRLPDRIPDVPIVEAQGWQIGDRGEVILTAQPQASPHHTTRAAIQCQQRARG
jgi:filamentous hemagglutinin family protein